MSVAVRGGTIFVADPQNACVFKVGLEPRSITPITLADGKPMQWPLDVDASPSGLAVADSQRGAVFLFDLNGNFQRSIGAGQLKRPSAVAWDGQHNRWWVLDTAAHACVIFDAGGSRVASIGGKGVAAGQFNFPAGMTYRAGLGAVVADSMNFRVQLMGADGKAPVVFGRKGDAAGDFSMPRDVATDSDGNIYVLDNQFENVQIFNRQQQLLMALGRGGAGPGQFNLPAGITIDDRDRIWIADTYNRRVQVFQYLKEAPQ
ncbi:MAG TPA: 6-bladed beta-propeller, partial [Phycisphaerae bacterium]|nr:6-bladed beta-propeller [Phycisphaerae bacterium]